jgi:hypothetical protein
MVLNGQLVLMLEIDQGAVLERKDQTGEVLVVVQIEVEPGRVQNAEGLKLVQIQTGPVFWKVQQREGKGQIQTLREDFQVPL